MQNATRVLLKKTSQLKKVIYDPVDVRISVSNTNVRSDGGGGGGVQSPRTLPSIRHCFVWTPGPTMGHLQVFQNKMTNAKQMPKSFCPKPLEAFLKYLVKSRNQ